MNTYWYCLALVSLFSVVSAFAAVGHATYAQQPYQNATIHLYESKSIYLKGETYVLRGYVSPPTVAKVLLTFTLPDGSIMTRSVGSDEHGNFTYSFFLGMAGSYGVYAQWVDELRNVSARSNYVGWIVTYPTTSVGTNETEQPQPVQPTQTPPPNDETALWLGLISLGILSAALVALLSLKRRHTPASDAPSGHHRRDVVVETLDLCLNSRS